MTPDARQAVFLAAYASELLNTSAALKIANISRWDYLQWRLRWPDFDRSCSDVEESILDKLETHAVHLAVGDTDSGNPGMLRDVLINLRRGRWKKPDADGAAGTLKIVITDGMAAKLDGGDAQI